MSEDDPVGEWLMIEAMRKKLFAPAWDEWDKFLKTMGHTKATFKELSRKGALMLNGELDTEHGKVVIEERDIWEHHNSKKIGVEKSLKLISPKH